MGPLVFKKRERGTSKINIKGVLDFVREVNYESGNIVRGKGYKADTGNRVQA